MDFPKNGSFELEMANVANSIFKEGGFLHASTGFEHRPEQEEFALSASFAFAKNENLVFEAQTGVGKTLAYLIAGITNAIKQNRIFVISTHTIALQEQILNKDLLIVRKIFAEKALQEYQNFKVAMLVGKANYLCTTRLEKLDKEKKDYLDDEEIVELERIKAWAKTTKTGLVSELEPLPMSTVWDLVNADSSVCSKKNCSPHICFYQKAKKHLQEAQVIILNHSLLFSLINAGLTPSPEDKGVLFKDDFLLIDEAHFLTDTATKHFGEKVSYSSINRVLKYLYNPKKKKGLFVRANAFAPLRAFIENAQIANEEFFMLLDYNFLQNKKTFFRLRAKNWADGELVKILNQVCDAIANVEHSTQDDKLLYELKDTKFRILGIRNELISLIDLADEKYVYWIEKTSKNNISVNSAPLEVAGILRKKLFLRNTSVILTSATMSIGKSMEDFCNKNGARGVNNFIVKSPFDFEKNMRVLSSFDAPDFENKIKAKYAQQNSENFIDSSKASEKYLDYLCEKVFYFCSNLTSGGSLVLFTNYMDMAEVYQILKNKFEKLGRKIFIQSKDKSRSKTLEEFKNAGNGILFGTDSFWTGIDVAGKALSQVIITKLPFLSPTDPIVEARSELAQKRGKNPFEEVFLPDSIIKFRQGIGRLIRKQSDKGLIVILDSRVLKKQYGQFFINSLPVSQKNLFSFNEKNYKLIFEKAKLF